VGESHRAQQPSADRHRRHAVQDAGNRGRWPWVAPAAPCPSRRAARTEARRIGGAAGDRHGGAGAGGDAGARLAAQAERRAAPGAGERPRGSRLAFQLYDPRKCFTQRRAHRWPIRQQRLAPRNSPQQIIMLRPSGAPPQPVAQPAQPGTQMPETLKAAG
jgi:hypothetical protein